jgi:alanine dehydrogenase
MVIGGGVVGQNAAEVAIGMGAEVYALVPQHRPAA